MPADRFSVRWTGRLQAPETGEYDLGTVADDGVRLWVDGKLLVDDWRAHAPEHRGGRIKLEAGRAYEIKLEYYEETGGAMVEPRWTLPSERRATETRSPQPAVRRVTLPAGTAWYDFWTGERLAGGQSIDVPAPLETMPLHVRAGSIVPLGPHLQYAHEKPADPIELRIYRGADGHLEMYEDEGDGYAYEKGASTIIPFEWNDAKATLTIGARRGSFPGMLKRRHFRVVFVKAGRGVGVEPSSHTDATVIYRGRPLTVKP